MNQLTYNASLLVGTAAASVGAGMQWGGAIGLMVAGALVIGLTLVGVMLNAKGTD